MAVSTYDIGMGFSAIIRLSTYPVIRIVVFLEEVPYLFKEITTAAPVVSSFSHDDIEFHGHFVIHLELPGHWLSSFWLVQV